VVLSAPGSTNAVALLDLDHLDHAGAAPMSRMPATSRAIVPFHPDGTGARWRRTYYDDAFADHAPEQDERHRTQ
jgi:hypothetical protein